MKEEHEGIEFKDIMLTRFGITPLFFTMLNLRRFYRASKVNHPMNLGSHENLVLVPREKFISLLIA